MSFFKQKRDAEFAFTRYASPSGIGGWLLYFCLSWTIFRPLLEASNLSKAPDAVSASIYVVLGTSSLMAGAMLWSKSQSAFLWIKIALIVQAAYAVFQLYVLLWLAHASSAVSGSRIDQTAASIATNIVSAMLTFLYFRLSKRVRNTFGRNL